MTRGPTEYLPRQALDHPSGPASRGCPIGYGISEVIAYHRPSEIVLIVLVDVFSVGFEGPDRRFLAVASTLPPL